MCGRVGKVSTRGRDSLTPPSYSWLHHSRYRSVMDFFERRWAFLRRRRERREQEAEAYVQRGIALREWLVDVVHNHPHEEAVDLFVEKVVRERIRFFDLGVWTSEGLDSKTLEVASEGQARLQAGADAAKRRVVERAPGAGAALTDRERKVLELLVKGLNNRDIGTELNLSEDAVKNHVRNILQKLAPPQAL